MEWYKQMSGGGGAHEVQLGPLVLPSLGRCRLSLISPNSDNYNISCSTGSHAGPRAINLHPIQILGLMKWIAVSWVVGGTTGNYQARQSL